MLWQEGHRDPESLITTSAHIISSTIAFEYDWHGWHSHRYTMIRLLAPAFFQRSACVVFLRRNQSWIWRCCMSAEFPSFQWVDVGRTQFSMKYVIVAMQAHLNAYWNREIKYNQCQSCFMINALQEILFGFNAPYWSRLDNIPHLPSPDNREFVCGGYGGGRVSVLCMLWNWGHPSSPLTQSVSMQPRTRSNDKLSMTR